MPATVQNIAPSISRIYASFDDDCYRAFRRAMARSRGGVVRVEDLLAALFETLPDSAVAALGLGSDVVARLLRPPTREQDLLPMVNEPTLRTALADAHAQAAGQPITPLLLLRAVAQFLPTSRMSSNTEAREPAPSLKRPAPPLPLTAETVQAILRRWLEVQMWPSPARDSALQQLANLTPPV